MPPKVAGKYSRNVMAWISAATRRRAAWNICSSVAYEIEQVETNFNTFQELVTEVLGFLMGCLKF